MAKYFYVYEKDDGTTNRVVKMFNGDNGAVADRVLPKEKVEGFCEGLSVIGFERNNELAEADTKEILAKEYLAEKMNEYHAARDAYTVAADNLKKMKAKLGL